jgi:hypothetical protein
MVRLPHIVIFAGALAQVPGPHDRRGFAVLKVETPGITVVNAAPCRR